MSSSVTAKPDGQHYSFGDRLILATFAVAAVGALVGFGWMVHDNAQWEQLQRRTAEHRVQETAADILQEFAALPASASKSVLQGVLDGRAVDLTEFNAQTGRTDVVIRIHEYFDTQHARLGHMRQCFAYTLISLDAGKPTYREVECTAGWSIWDAVV